MKALAIAAFLLIAAGSRASAAESEPDLSPGAKRHLDAGLTAYANKDYEIAIAEFRAAHALSPRRDILWAWAQAERLSGDCPSAVVLYRKFLSTNPSADEVAAAEQNLARCEKALATQPEPAPAPTAPRSPTLRPAALAVDPLDGGDGRDGANRPRWYQDRGAGALFGAGVLFLGVGTGYLIAAGSAQDDAMSAFTYEEYGARMDTASSRRTIGVVSLIGGAALAGAGVLRWSF